MLTISEKSLDWALKHIEKYGDTDLYPFPFEYKVIREYWDQGIKEFLLKQDLTKWTVNPCRRLLAPKHLFGFRVATQLDPIDSILFTALVYEMGEEIEDYRIDKEEKICFSNRFSPNKEGDMFDEDYNWNAFQKRSRELIERKKDKDVKYKYVVVADIADFFPRIYSHPLENALTSCTVRKNYVTSITNMLKSWSYNVSYGIPVGQTATSLLAEIAIDDVDRLLNSEGFKHCRFVDDYRIFCETEKEAYEALATLANTLFENHGLTLQQHKTKILTREAFIEKYLVSTEDKTLNNLSGEFSSILEEIGIDSYSSIQQVLLPKETMEKLDKLNMIDILKEQLLRGTIDYKLVSFILIRLSKLNDPRAIALCIENIDQLYPITKTFFDYIHELTCLTAEEKSNYGKQLLDTLDTSIVGHLSYHRMWLFDLFAKDTSWNNTDEYVRLYKKYSADDFSKRKLILAMGKSGNYAWFKSEKRNFDRLDPWGKRAFLLGASCLPGDEAKHWYRSVEKRLDFLEKYIINWALNYSSET